jgi:ferredoxin
VFILDESGKSVVVDSDGASLDVLLEAAEACPCQAIEVDDEDGPQFP